jgi:hypothetical protein
MSLGLLAFTCLVALFTRRGAACVALWGLGFAAEAIVVVICMSVGAAIRERHDEPSGIKERIVEKIRTVEKKVFVERLTRQDAFAILNLSAPVTREQVTDAYKAMMKRVHPDLGGSPYLAKKVNEAKQLLLGK